jgi:hypothetical protein
MGYSAIGVPSPSSPYLSAPCTDTAIWLKQHYIFFVVFMTLLYFTDYCVLLDLP